MVASTYKESTMEPLRQTRFEQVPLALALKIAKAEAKATKLRTDLKEQKRNGDDK